MQLNETMRKTFERGVYVIKQKYSLIIYIWFKKQSYPTLTLKFPHIWWKAKKGTQQMPNLKSFAVVSSAEDPESERPEDLFSFPSWKGWMQLSLVYFATASQGRKVCVEVGLFHPPLSTKQPRPPVLGSRLLCSMRPNRTICSWSLLPSDSLASGMDHAKDFFKKKRSLVWLVLRG